uniref:Peptidase S54 rhomboid domain-containing protein n=1 Tax=Tetraselmis sp. GSL018 TaxID=582737 RepID=A0A061SPC5_9CHLO
MGCFSLLKSAVWQNCLILVLISVAVFIVQVMGTAGVYTEIMCLRPRTPEGLVGLLGSPFVHKSWLVMLSNLIGIWALGFLLLLQGQTVFVLTFLWISVFGGMLTFSFARAGTHCGMASELCGFFSFLVFAVIWQRPVSPRTVLGLIAALFLYGGSMAFALVSPTGSNAWHSSWESKAFGFLAGALWALLFFKVFMKLPAFAAYVKGSSADVEAKRSGTETPVGGGKPGSSNHAPASRADVSPSRPSLPGFLFKKKPGVPLHKQEERGHPSPLYSSPRAPERSADVEIGNIRGGAAPVPAVTDESAGGYYPRRDSPEPHAAGTRFGGAWGPSMGGAWG